MGIGSENLNDRLPNALAVVEAIEVEKTKEGFRSSGMGREGILDPDESGHTILQDLPALVDAAQTLVALMAHIYKHFATTPSPGPGFNPPRGAAALSVDNGPEVLRHLRSAVASGAFLAPPAGATGTVDSRDIPYEDARFTNRSVQGGPIDPNAVMEMSGGNMGPAGQVARGIEVPGGPGGPLQYLTIGMYIAEKVLPRILSLIQKIKNR